LDLFSLVYFESILCSRLTVEINRNKIPIRDLVQEDRDDQFLVRLEAKPGKEDEVAPSLRQGLSLVRKNDNCGVVRNSAWAFESRHFRRLNGRVLLAAFFVGAGIMHFVVPDAYLRIVPPALPARSLLVVLSGIAEILGGFGLLAPFARRMAAWGLVLLLFAVFPANIYTAVSHLPFPGILGQTWAQWLRLPLQLPLILWTLRYTRAPQGREFLPTS
jgi:uncharacterized membrane protein